MYFVRFVCCVCEWQDHECEMHTLPNNGGEAGGRGFPAVVYNLCTFGCVHSKPPNWIGKRIKLKTILMRACGVA